MPTPSTAARARRAALAVALPLLLVAGCSDNPEPSAATTPSASPSPTATASDSPAAPELPAAARENTPEGAEAFVRHWVEVLNSTRSGVGGQAIRRHSADGCIQCRAISETADEIRAGSLVVDGGDWHVATSTINPYDPPEGDLIVVTRMEINQGSVTRDGQSPSPTQSSTKSISFVLDWQDRWIVLEIRTPS
ncbi:DUF6318 family protein [Nocardioides massiliensis]|uniref:DUF6318 domain-containing protein n=1 Tax=Nocardioides massiliensis TaxID=1325935 RepID=A0ABT9NUA1_9ACTN|nr:DUF6318 family protein [Nocardioides massiliensis]MDP9823415.1 hypothetical protein [Nocardioides massiliensis]